MKIEHSCMNCNQEFEGNIMLDKLGWHTVCPKCGSSFDVDVPEGKIKMLFLDTEAVEDFDVSVEDDVPICSFYAFDSVPAFISKWQEICEKPDSMWYWVYDGDISDENLVCSGACDPYDIDCFREHFFCNVDGVVYPAPHERNPKYTYWLYDPEEDRVYHTSEDTVGRSLAYQKRRNSLYYDAATNLPLIPQPAFYIDSMRRKGRKLAQKYIG